MSRRLSYDRVMFACAVTAIVVGLAMIYSASAIIAIQKLGSGSPVHFFIRQCAFLVVGSAMMFLTMHLDISRLRDWRLLSLLMVLLIIVLVLVLFQPPINGSRRWFTFGSVNAQPAEAAKIVVILTLAAGLSARRDRVDEWTGTILPLGGVTAIPLGLILLEPDLGTAVVLGAVVGTMFFVAGIGWKKIILCSTGVIPLAIAFLLGAEYRRARIEAFLNPDSDPLGHGFQAMQSLIAFGAGGLTGMGIGNGRQKLFYLPEPHTDFIYAIVGEELGFIGAALLLAVFGVLVWRGWRVAWRSTSSFERYLAIGLTSLIAYQVLVNVSVALALLPTKGITLPLVSYGGSSLVTSMTCVGLLLNLSQHTD